MWEGFNRFFAGKASLRVEFEGSRVQGFKSSRVQGVQEVRGLEGSLQAKRPFGASEGSLSHRSHGFHRYCLVRRGFLFLHFVHKT